MPRFLYFILRTFMIIAGACIVGVLFSIFGWWQVSIFTSVFFGFAGMVVAGRPLDESKKGAMVAVFAGLIIVAGTAFMASFTIEHQFWPGTISNISVDEAAAHRWVSAFHFRDGRVLSDKMETADIWGGSAKSRATRVDVAFVAPVVPDDWTPDRAVAVWAVATRDSYPERSRLWKQPVRAGSRIVGFNESYYLEAVKSAESVYDLKSAANPVFIEWTPSPEASVKDTWKRMGFIVLVGASLMIIFVGIVRIIQAMQKPKSWRESL